MPLKKLSVTLDIISRCLCCLYLSFRLIISSSRAQWLAQTIASLSSCKYHTCNKLLLHSVLGDKSPQGHRAAAMSSITKIELTFYPSITCLCHTCQTFSIPSMCPLHSLCCSFVHPKVFAGIIFFAWWLTTAKKRKTAKHLCR